ncbi:peptidyl-prolyl cis-trans isomerase [Pseudomonadota bacterium]
MLKIWLREPLLHFLLIGAALFLLYGLQNETIDDDKNRIVVSKNDIDHLKILWKKKWQRLPTTQELKGLIEQQIREEVLYREALAMGLDQNDTIVRRRLAQKVEFISADLAAQVEPTEAQLMDHIKTNADKFEVPARVDFVQVFLSTDRRGENVENDAKRLLDELQKADSKVDIKAAGDSIMLGAEHKQLSIRAVSRMFGRAFAEKLFALPVGSWQGPIPSAYGLHLIRIDSKAMARQPELQTVREKVRDNWHAQQRRNLDEAFYKSLRQRYKIVIESDNQKDSIASAKK